MKTSLVSTAASSLAISTSTSTKADRPQQLKSVTVYFRGRKMVLMQRPQRRLPLLLCHMLRRSMRTLFGTLSRALPAAKRVLSAGALCAMALASVTTAHATASAPLTPPPPNTLPDGYTVKYGQVGVSTTGNQMNVDIGTNKAIINWNSFSIGSAAGVDFHFANATSSSSVLNRVTGNDPSQIMGSLTSNGKVFLINSAGILVGKNAKIDVAGFVASTLNIRNEDFLANKLTFHGNVHGTTGSNAGVMIEQDGSIKTSEGGSVYLIGSTVENDGVITSPNGEVLLAAGKSVDLVDTGTPGVKINVKGKQGKITNLGKIMVDTGVIGFGAALIDNRGMLNASSVDKAGGRIFLRASKDLTTTETSSINADGTTGGNVVLYADNSADIGGDVSAVGNVDGNGGKGGYVETSGKRSLAVKYVPRISSGGQWFIDPRNVDILSSATLVNNGVNQQDGVITATGDNATIYDGTINSQLNNNVNVVISTGDSGTQVGDITVNSGVSINRSVGAGANLTLTAAHNITIQSGASITDTEATGTMGLMLNAGGAIASDGIIQLKGDLIASAASYTSNGTTALAGGNMNVTTSGDQVLGTVTGAGALKFTSNSGGISQKTGTALAGNSITAAAITGITLGNAGNAISNSFAATNGTSGDIAFVNSATSTLSLGALSNSNGGISISTAGRANTTSQITAAKGAASIVAAGITVSSNGIIARDISLTSTGANTLNVNGKLQASAINGTVTVASGGDLTVQQTSCISAPVSAGGLVSMTSAGNMTIQSDVTGHDISLTTTGTGNMNVGGDLTANAESGSVTSHSAGGLVTGPNSIWSDNSAISAGGTVSMTAVGNLISQSDVTAHDISLTTATGDIEANGNLTANATSGTITMSSGGAIVLGRDDNLFYYHNAVSAGGLVSLTSVGSMSLVGSNLSGGNINLKTTGADGDIYLYSVLSTPGTLTIESGRGIQQEAEVGITAATVNATAHNGRIDLGFDGNYIGTFIGKAEATGEGTNDISLHNSQNLVLGNVSSSQGNINIETTGTMTVGAEGANVTLSAQQINLTTQKGGEGGQGGGESFVVGGGGDAPADMIINAKLSASAQEHGVVLSSDGAITQAAGAGGINTNTLDINSTGGTTLASGNNHIGSLSALNYESGDIVINNASSELLLSGNIDNEATGGNISITNTGKITASTNLLQGEGDDFYLDTGIFADNKVTLTSTTSDVTLAQVNATDLVVSAAQGAIKSYSNEDNGDLISLQISGTMTASAKTGITLNENSNVTFGNHIANFSATNSGSGDITLVNHNTEGSNNLLAISNSGSGDIRVTNYGGLTTSGAIHGNGGVTLTANGDSSSGAITIGGTITAGTIFLQSVIGDNASASTDIAVNGALTADTVNIASGQGAITQTAGITAGSMSATAVKGITLNSNNNKVSGFSSANLAAGSATAAGDIIFKNTSTGTASHMLTTGGLTNSAGNISIENTGRMDVNGAVNAPNGSVSLVTHSPLNINGTVNANGNINFAAGDVNHAAIGDGITISAAVTSATGTVGFSSLNVNLNALVNGPGGINIQAHTVNVTVPPLQQPHIDITPGVPDPVVVSTPPPLVTTTTVDQNVASTSNNVNNNVTETTTPVTTTQTNTLNNNSNQTAGGGDGEFGGSRDDGKGKGEKSNKPTPVCT